MGLGQKEKELIRSRILLKLRGLEEDIYHLKEITKPVAPENSIGRISRMDAINNKSVNEATLRNSIERESKLKVALSELGSDNYGLCRKCGNLIEMGRLLIIPEGKLCMQCLKR